MHDVFIIVRQGRLLRVGIVTEVIGWTRIQVEGRCQDEGDFFCLFETVDFAVDVQQEVALKSRSGAADAIDAIEFLAVGVQGGDFENVLKECDFGA